MKTNKLAEMIGKNISESIIESNNKYKTENEKNLLNEAIYKQIEPILGMYLNIISLCSENKEKGFDLSQIIEQVFNDIKKVSKTQESLPNVLCPTPFDNINKQSGTQGLNIQYKDTKIEDVGTKAGEIFDVLKGTNIGQDIGKIFDKMTKDITIDLTPSKKDFFSMTSGGFNFFDFLKNKKF